MRKIITISLILFMAYNSYSQEKEEQNSKMEVFVSQKGAIIKFEDYELANIKSSYGTVESKVRKLL